MTTLQINPSELTLVNPESHTGALTHVTFSRDDMKNTKVLAADPSDSVLYTVETDKTSDSHTIVYRGEAKEQKEVVAEVKRYELRSDTIKFGINLTLCSAS